MKARVSLRARLAFLAGLPLCCAAALGLLLTMDRVSSLNEFVSFREAMNLANGLAAVNEANNAELGNAWCWTPTAATENGTKVVEEIRATWTENGKALDRAYADLQKIRDRLDLSRYDPSLGTILGQVDAAKAKLADHRQRMRQTMEYNLIIEPYTELKVRIQTLYPALLKETSDKDLAQRLTAYNLYLDYHSACVQYIGVMIWAHQVNPVPPGGYARYESYYRESETLLKHFRNLAPAGIVAQVDSLLQDERGRWVDEKVRSFLTTNDTFHEFWRHRALEQEFKTKGEGRNADLGKIMAALRADIMSYTDSRIAELSLKRNLVLALTVLVVGLTLGFALVFGASLSRLLAGVTSGIADGACQLFAAAKQITQASEGLAQSAAEQTATVDETLRQIESVRAMTASTSATAKTATSTIQRTSQAVSISNGIMGEMNTSMQQIARNSADTKKILRTINEIAFQTNILALNAAVEAARAGEQGAGFAIVAEEVRNLAQRSASAANSTESLLEGSNSCIDHGTIAAKRANDSLGDVLSSTGEVLQQFASIEQGAQRQAAAFDEIFESATQVGRITHSNAAAAEQCSAAALSLNDQATQLETWVRDLETLVHGQNARRFTSRPQVEPVDEPVASAAR